VRHVIIDCLNYSGLLRQAREVAPPLDPDAALCALVGQGRWGPFKEACEAYVGARHELERGMPRALVQRRPESPQRMPGPRTRAQGPMPLDLPAAPADPPPLVEDPRGFNRRRGLWVSAVHGNSAARGRVRPVHPGFNLRSDPESTDSD